MGKQARRRQGWGRDGEKGLAGVRWAGGVGGGGGEARQAWRRRSRAHTPLAAPRLGRASAQCARARSWEEEEERGGRREGCAVAWAACRGRQRASMRRITRTCAVLPVGSGEGESRWSKVGRLEPVKTSQAWRGLSWAATLAVCADPLSTPSQSCLHPPPLPPSRFTYDLWLNPLPPHPQSLVTFRNAVLRTLDP
eukprot:3895889-Rhodomonas_salina.1